MTIAARTSVVRRVINHIRHARPAFGFQSCQGIAENDLGFAAGINVAGGGKALRQGMALLAGGSG